MKNIEELMKKIQKIEEKGELSDEALAAAVGGATMPDLSIYNLQGRTVDAIRCPLCKGVADYSSSMFTIYLPELQTETDNPIPSDGRDFYDTGCLHRRCC